MHVLAGQIAKDIKERGLSAIYGIELNRVWPRNGVERKERIEKFANEHGWRLCHYRDGFVAIFDESD